MSNNKQNHIGEANKMITSVEWLFYKLWETPKDKLNWHSILKQAKAMHKEEIERAHYDGSVIVMSKPDDDMLQLSQQYYNETFGGNNEL
jgi:hypothetical protein